MNAELIIANRRDAMLERFPNAIFKDLSGKSYYGWCALKRIRQKEKEKQPNYDPATDYYRLFEVYRAQYETFVKAGEGWIQPFASDHGNFTL